MGSGDNNEKLGDYMKIIKKAATKINLGIETPFRHPDRIPEWNMIMTSIDLAYYVTVSDIPEIKIEVISNELCIPNDCRNLAYQAAMLLQKNIM